MDICTKSYLYQLQTFINHFYTCVNTYIDYFYVQNKLNGLIIFEQIRLYYMLTITMKIPIGLIEFYKPQPTVQKTRQKHVNGVFRIGSIKSPHCRGRFYSVWIAHTGSASSNCIERTLEHSSTRARRVKIWMEHAVEREWPPLVLPTSTSFTMRAQFELIPK